MNRFFRGRIKSFYLVSFLFVFIVPIAIAITAFYMPVNNMLKDEAESASSAKSRQIKDAIDFRIKEIYNLSIKMSMDNSIKKFAYRERPFSNTDIYLQKEVVDILNTYISSNNFITYLAVYFPGNSSVITCEGKYDTDFFLEKVLRYSDMKYKDAESIMRGENNGYLPLQNISGMSSINGRYVTFLKSIMLTKSRVLANIVILIDERTLLTMLSKSSPGYEGQFMILTGDGSDIALQGESSLLKKVLLDNLNDTDQTFVLDAETKGKYMISFSRSDVSDWKYIALTNMIFSMSKLRSIRNITYIIALCCCIVGVVMSLIMSRFSYMPWKKLVDIVKNENFRHADDVVIKNEYLFTSDALTRILSERNSMKNSLAKSRNHVISSILHALCSGKYVSIDDLNSNGISFRYKDFAAAVLNLHISGGDRVSLAAVAARIRQISSNNHELYSYEESRGRLCVIINYEGSSSIHLKEVLNQMKEILEGYTEIGWLFIGVGETYNDYENIYLSYSEAIKSIEYSFLKEKDSIIYYSQIKNYTFLPNLPIEYQNHLCNVLKAGDYQMCCKYLDEFFTSLNQNNDYSIEYLHCIYYNLLSIAFKVCQEADMEFNSFFNKEAGQPLDIRRFENSRQLIGSVYKMYEGICDYFDNNKDSHNHVLKDKITEYVNKSYMNSNLSLKEMAHEIKFASPYLSKFMKEQFGMGFGDYVNSIRLESAKELLGDRKEQIYKISERCGYTSINSFIRTFKRLEGITPGQYRDEQLKKKVNISAFPV